MGLNTRCNLLTAGTGLVVLPLFFPSLVWATNHCCGKTPPAPNPTMLDYPILDVSGSFPCPPEKNPTTTVLRCVLTLIQGSTGARELAILAERLLTARSVEVRRGGADGDRAPSPAEAKTGVARLAFNVRRGNGGEGGRGHTRTVISCWLSRAVECTTLSTVYFDNITNCISSRVNIYTSI